MSICDENLIAKVTIITVKFCSLSYHKDSQMGLKGGAYGK